MPGIPQQALPYIRREEREEIDQYDNDERFVRPSNLKAFRQLKALKEHFGKNQPDFRYRKCLGWGGNGLAAAFDVIDVYGFKLKSVVVKMLFSESRRILRRETQSCELVFSDILSKVCAE